MTTKDTVLRSNFWEKEIEPALEELRPLRARRKIATLVAVVTFILLVRLVVMLNTSIRMIMGNDSDEVGVVTVFAGFASFIIAGSIYTVIAPKKYRLKYKHTIATKILSFCRFPWKPNFNTTPGDVDLEDKNLLKRWEGLVLESGLFGVSQRYISCVFDDILEAHLGNVKIECVEARVFEREDIVFKRKQNSFFRGIFFIITTEQSLEGVTFIKTKKDKFIKIGRGLRGLRETDLEWNDFERLLEVVTNHPREAREILTPDFMHILYEWWKEEKLLIRMAMKDNRLYISIPSVKMFEPTPYIRTKEHKRQIERYLGVLLMAENLIEKFLENERLYLRKFNTNPAEVEV